MPNKPSEQFRFIHIKHDESDVVSEAKRMDLSRPDKLLGSFNNMVEIIAWVESGKFIQKFHEYYQNTTVDSAVEKFRSEHNDSDNIEFRIIRNWTNLDKEYLLSKTKQVKLEEISKELQKKILIDMEPLDDKGGNAFVVVYTRSSDVQGFENKLFNDFYHADDVGEVFQSMRDDLQSQRSHTNLPKDKVKILRVIFGEAIDVKKYNNNVISEEKSNDKIDTVEMDIPMLTRILEYVREDVDNDVSLHFLLSNLIKLAHEHGCLTMENYNEAVDLSRDASKEILDNIKKLENY